ncbi:MAG TPA: ATP-binding protein [Tepidisphaeraceae bacterium]|jgi:signal transduction histidine kinase
MAAFPPLPAVEESALDRLYAKKTWSRRLFGWFGMQTKLTVAIILLMAVTLASYGFVSLQDTRHNLKDNLTAEAQQASAMLAVLAAEMPSDLSTPAMRRVVGPFVKTSKDILFVSLLDRDGEIILTEARNGPIIPPSPVKDLQSGLTSWVKDSPFGPHLVSTAPILRQHSDVGGFVRVGVSVRQYDVQVAKTTEAISRVGLALVLLAVPTAWLIVRRMFLPIRQLVNAAQRIAAGEVATRVATGRRDLIGDLARAFNHMVQTITHQQNALQHANQQLHEANRDLESKIEQRTAQMETANKRLSLEIAEKEDFLRAISHDLNAPLRNISGMVTMLQTKKKDQLDDDAKHRLERIKKNVEVETDLINELLELSRIKTRRGAMESMNLEQMVWDLRGMFENDLRTKDILLVVDTVLPELHAERARVRQVFQNLIDNAIKYMGDGPRREIHIGCQLRMSEAEFYVRDTGQGIEAEDLGKVFFVFRRGKNQAAQSVSGKGIGLASVKSIVETYAGKIWVESVFGEGSTFRFTVNGQHVPLLGGGKTIDDAEGGQPLAA